MNGPVITREMIRDCARRAFAAGKSRDDHEMNWNAPALPTWLGEYDRLVAEKSLDAAMANRRTA